MRNALHYWDLCLFQQDGYWEDVTGCIKCQCDEDGAQGSTCDQLTGQCTCRAGVGGLRCNLCLTGYYGFGNTGCKRKMLHVIFHHSTTFYFTECDTCNKKGHICDPDTGRCVCPPYSHGEFCHLCSANTWGYEPNKGCKVRVHSFGSSFWAFLPWTYGGFINLISIGVARYSSKSARRRLHWYGRVDIRVEGYG